MGEYSRIGLAYHEATSHGRHTLGGHYLDFANQPWTTKSFGAGFEVVQLPKGDAPPAMSVEQALQAAGGPGGGRLDLDVVAGALRLAWRVSVVTGRAGRNMPLRNVPSAGALYPAELHVSLAGIEGIADGHYYYCPVEQTLTLLRGGRFFEASQGGSLTCYVTAVFFRSAWKYRERAYRYCLLDAGHLTENATLALGAYGLSPEVDYHCGPEVERFMGLDPVREGCLAIIRCAGAEPVHPPLEEERTEDLARGSRCAILDDPPQAILDVHDRTRHDDGSGVVDFSSLLTTRANAVNLHGAEWSESGCPLPDCIAERRSRRNYVPRNIPREFVEAMLRLMRLDEDRGGPWRYAPAGLLVQNVTGLDAGFYLPTDGGHGPVIHGSMMREMARICLEQMWLMSASLHVMFLADLAALERSLGPIGYRVAMLSAGRLGQRVYLGAVQHDLGACGIGAYFDDEAERFLHLGASEKMLYMVAAGPVKK